MTNQQVYPFDADGFRIASSDSVGRPIYPEGSDAEQLGIAMWVAMRNFASIAGEDEVIRIAAELAGAEIFYEFLEDAVGVRRANPNHGFQKLMGGQPRYRGKAIDFVSGEITIGMVD